MANSPISIIAIFEEFRNNYKQLEWGEIAFKNGHVKRVILDSNLTSLRLKGEVQAGMQGRNYSVEIICDGNVKAKRCTCTRDQIICHHIAALLLYAHYNINSTDRACLWNDPKASWSFKPQADYINFVPSIEEILYSEEYVNAINKEKYFFSKCYIPKENISIIAAETIGQCNNEKWFVARKLRLTSSMFGSILSACKRHKFSNSFMKRLLHSSNLDNIAAIRWGKNKETKALEQFEILKNNKVTLTGLWIDEYGILGASPDGLINDDGVLEIKCPYKYRSDSLKAGVQDRSYVFYYEDDNIIIKKNHAYYHQIQAQLYFTNRKYCYLFIWTPNEYECIRIEKDVDWSPNIDILRHFYLNIYIPFILSNFK